MAQNNACEVPRTRRAASAKGRARVASVASKHGATRVVVGAKNAAASVRVGAKACRCGELDTGLSNRRRMLNKAHRIVKSKGRDGAARINARGCTYRLWCCYCYCCSRQIHRRQSRCSGCCYLSQSLLRRSRKTCCERAAGARVELLSGLAMRRKKSRWAREVMQLGRGRVQSRRRALLKGSRKRAKESAIAGCLLVQAG
jgi:hypothetical protein